VAKVQYEVQNARVGQMTDYDKLILEVWTDGSLTAEEAVRRSARILQEAMGVFAPAATEAAPIAPANAAAPADATGKLKELVGQPVDLIELSARASNCLKAAKIKTMGELISKTEEELMGFKNFGKKSLEEIKERLKEMNLDLGMISPAEGKPQ
jgi:DNA-directed RNA polymerase subunit alpha